MPSFQIIPVPEDAVDLENIQEQIENLNIREDASQLKRGTLPETYGQTEEGTAWFWYGVQEEFEFNQLDATGTGTRLEEYTVAFLGNGFIAISNADNETTDDLLSLIEHQFTEGVSLETTRFSEDALRRIIVDASETIKAHITPKKRSKPERVSGKDRNLPDTDFWDEYGDEPLEKIKVNVGGDEKESRVGFDEYGVVILYKQSLTLPEQVAVLQSLAENQFSRIIDPDNYQSTLSHNEEDN